MTITILALFPNLRLPGLSLWGEHSDFFYHTIGFMVLTAVAAVATERFALAVASIAMLAIGLELLQALVPGREVFLSDLVASLLGVTLSAFLMPIAMQGWRWCVQMAWLRYRP